MNLHRVFDIDILRFHVGRKLASTIFRRPKPPLPHPGEPYIAPGQNSQWHDGFVNSEANPMGLQARFFRDRAGGVACVWENSRKEFSGYPGIIHGGISASLLDELMANAMVEATGHFGITLRSSLQWVRPIRVGERVTGRAFVKTRRGVIAVVEGALFRSDGKVAAEGRNLFLQPTLEEFQRMSGVRVESEEIKSAFRPAAAG